jgi:hypothetical protein
MERLWNIHRHRGTGKALRKHQQRVASLRPSITSMIPQLSWPVTDLLEIEAELLCGSPDGAWQCEDDDDDDKTAIATGQAGGCPKCGYV